jgi:hypothetical protein
MAVPTRTELHAEVDRLFREQHPDAPKKLDPDDPGQASLVEAWLEIRDTVVNEWTNKVFYEHFPAAGKLDPNDPGDEQLIGYWLDIRNQFRDDAAPRYNWDDPGAVPTADADTKAAARLESVTADSGGYLLTFDAEIDREALGLWLWPAGVPAGVELAARSATTFHLSGLSWESYQAMNSNVAGMIAQAGVITAEPYDPSAVQETGARVRAPAPTGKPYPEIDIDTPEELQSWLEEKAHTGVEIGHVAEIIESLTMMTENIAYTRAVAAVGVDAVEGLAWGGAGVAEVVQFHRVAAVAEVIGVVSKVLAVVGDVALIFWVGYQVIGAFKAERENQRRYGYLYGVMWEALDEPDHIRTYNAPGITYSEEELRDAFVAGVAEGRAKGADLEIKNGIKVWVAAVAVGEGVDEYAAKTRVLTALYDKAFDRESRFEQKWPTPFEYPPY